MNLPSWGLTVIRERYFTALHSVAEVRQAWFQNSVSPGHPRGKNPEWIVRTVSKSVEGRRAVLRRLDTNLEAFLWSLEAMKEASERAGTTRDLTSTPDQDLGDVKVLRDAS